MLTCGGTAPGIAERGDATIDRPLLVNVGQLVTRVKHANNESTNPRIAHQVNTSFFLPFLLTAS